VSRHDDIMAIMADGQERTTPDVVQLIYPGITGYKRTLATTKLKKYMDNAVKYRFLERCGERINHCNVPVHVYRLVQA